MSKTTVELLLTRVEVLERAVERLKRHSHKPVDFTELYERVEALERKIEAQAEHLSSMASNRFLARIETSAAE